MHGTLYRLAIKKNASAKFCRPDKENKFAQIFIQLAAIHMTSPPPFAYSGAPLSAFPALLKIRAADKLAAFQGARSAPTWQLQ